MSFSSINIQGNIISSEILDKIRTEEKFKHQSPEAFGLARSASLRDEIGMAWSIMRKHWQAYKKRLETLPKGDTGTSLTREKLIIPLLSELAYQVGIQRAQQVSGKSYAISHGATNKDNFPIHIMGYNDNLDKRRNTGGPRLSPHALVQEYLNNTEHLFALVTNGKQLRLLRDATRLVRMSYLEFDLERMFEEELYADFSLLFRVLHASRMPEQIDAGADSVIEYYHLESMLSGTRIRGELSKAVEKSIKKLANGFLAHKKNENLIALFENKEIDAGIYYMHQLRLIYRILFLIVLEERKLVYPEDLDEEQQRLRGIYYRYYSIERLRKLAENRVYVDADKYDLWESLKTTFLLFEDGEFGSKMGIKPLGSGLFASNALGTLKEQFLSNGDLVEVLKQLTSFVSDQGQLVRVNYSDLDVEEFGSVYEGLLEYDPAVEKIGTKFEFSFVAGSGRGDTGAHYTPEELVKPLIKHSLDYIIEDKLKEPNPEEALLSITVCDVACGSGHILLSAARKIATELASIREGAEQPSPTYYRAAIRDVIRNCIYGVDLNPLAVELCKVALWLEAHNPNEPLNFLDHHIKNGNAIVGLAHFEELNKGIASEAFKALPGDEKGITTLLRNRNKKEQAEYESGAFSQTLNTSADVSQSLQNIKNDFAKFVAMPEGTPEQIKAKEEAYKSLTNSKTWYRLKNLADLQVAQFFIPKIEENSAKITTDKQYRNYLNAGTQIMDRGASMTVAQNKHFFHWFLEFPEILSKGGFDCILGNPPFLGGLRITKSYGHAFLKNIQLNFPECKGACDLVAYFFRRNYSLINNTGFVSLICTNTISQGDTREGSLDVILKNGGTINFAIKSIKWPGEAAVEVSLVSITKKNGIDQFLNNRQVERINSLLVDQNMSIPFALYQSSNISYKGVFPLGKGFVLEKEEAFKLLKNPINETVVKPYLIGDDLNNNPDQSAGRYIINFGEMSKAEASQFEECLSIIKERVKPIRETITYSKSAKEKWWLFERCRPELYNKLHNSKSMVLVSCTVTKYLSFCIQPNNWIFDVGTNVIIIDSFAQFSIFQSVIHEAWARQYGSSMKSDLRYTNEDCIKKFTFPKGTTGHGKLQWLGKNYHEFRKELMKDIGLGLTKTYNSFHAQKIQASIKTHDFKSRSKKEIEKQFGKAVWYLWNHLHKTEEACTWEEAVKGIVELRQLHKQMDEAVLEAYGWHIDNEKWGKAIDLRHDFYEVDYLPENDRLRYTIHLEARKEVLKRLLLLNHERYEEEIMEGLHKKKDVIAFYAQKGKPVPEGITFYDAKKSKVKPQKKIDNNKFGNSVQKNLFSNVNETSMREFGVNEGIYSIGDAATIIGKPYATVRRWFMKLASAEYEGLDNQIQNDIDLRRISFHGLVELVVIGTLLENNFKIKTIFKARTDLAKKSNKMYPFATNNVRDNLKVAGKEIIFEFTQGLVSLDGTGQFNLELIRDFFRDIEFNTSGIAQRLIPAKGLGKIVIDPRVGGGKPSIKNNLGIQVDTIVKFYDGPDSLDDLIEDYGVTKDEIEAALAYLS